MKKQTSTVASASSADPAVKPDVAIARFRPNGSVDALDAKHRPVHELCGHSRSKWELIRPRLLPTAALFLMVNGVERKITEDAVRDIQRWT